MSVEDAAPTVFSADNDSAALLHMRAQGVSVLMQLKPSGLPVILHWGADLGDLDGLTADALLAAFGPTGLDPLPSMMSSLLPEASAGWNSRAALAGSHDGHVSAASFTRSHARLISDTPVVSGITETGDDTVIIEATDAVNKLGLDIAIQLTANGLVRCRAGVTNKNIADYRLEGLELLHDAAVVLERPGGDELVELGQVGRQPHPVSVQHRLPAGLADQLGDAPEHRPGPDLGLRAGEGAGVSDQAPGLLPMVSLAPLQRRRPGPRAVRVGREPFDPGLQGLKSRWSNE